MADHVIDANWVKTSNVDLGESGFQQSRSRGPRRSTRRCAGMPPPRDDRCYCPAGVCRVGVLRLRLTSPVMWLRPRTSVATTED